MCFWLGYIGGSEPDACLWLGYIGGSEPDACFWLGSLWLKQVLFTLALTVCELRVGAKSHLVCLIIVVSLIRLVNCDTLHKLRLINTFVLISRVKIRQVYM